LVVSGRISLALQGLEISGFSADWLVIDMGQASSVVDENCRLVNNMGKSLRTTGPYAQAFVYSSDFFR
jgi:hypothetical protein